MTVTYLPTACLRGRELDARFTRDVEPLLDVLARGARRLARSEADAEDLLQDTLLRAYTGYHTFADGHEPQGLVVPHLVQPLGQRPPRQTLPGGGGVRRRRRRA